MLLLIPFLLLVSGCLGLEEQLPGTEIPAAPSLEIGTATAIPADINETDSDEDGAGFPTPEETAASPTTEPTLTALPTAIQLPTPTIQPVSVPPLQSLNPSNLPPTNQDLSYIVAGNLMLWTHQNQRLSPLFVPQVDTKRFPIGTFAEVTLADFSADGNRAVVAVRYDLPPEDGVAGDGSGDSDPDSEPETGETEFDILFIDVVSKESWLMISSIKDEINQLTISPNQAYITFATLIDDGRNDDAAMGEFQELDGKLFRFNTPAAISPSELTQVAECTGKCRQVTWRQDSDLYFFSDQLGAYFANARSSTAELLIENQTKDQFYPLAWSPNDRAVLMLDRPGEGGASYAIFDIPTQKLIPIQSRIQPDTVQLPETIWLADSRIMAAFVSWESRTVFLATYRVNFDDGSIGLDEEVALPELGLLGSLKQLPDGQFVFIRPHLMDPNIAGLYRLTSFSEEIERLTGVILSGDTPTTYWSLNGSTAVIQSMNSYIAAADGNLYQFEQRLSQPRWLPPSNAQR